MFCTDRPIARPEREDLLAIGNAGAYGYELANQFHSQPRPAEVAIEAGDSEDERREASGSASGGTASDERVVRRRETMADVVRVEDEAGE